MMLAAERALIADCGRRLVADRLVVGAAGNLSVRSGDLVAITPSGMDYEGLEAASVCVVDLDGRRLDGPARASSEVLMHLAVYGATEARAVVHTHSPFVSALAAVVDELPAVHYTILDLGGPLRVAPYATFGSTQLAEGLLGVVEGRSAAILASHGGLTWGATMSQAYRRAQLLEWLAEVYWRASLLGQPRVLSAQQLAEVAAQAERVLGQPAGAGARGGPEVAP